MMRQNNEYYGNSFSDRVRRNGWNALMELLSAQCETPSCWTTDGPGDWLVLSIKLKIDAVDRLLFTRFCSVSGPAEEGSWDLLLVSF